MEQMVEIYIKYICLSKIFSVGVSGNVLLGEI